ncbi:hypothetical protein [Bacillus thuringiensis]|uniref:Uncharacterized protein n=1 Tax=Bacillus thuringiensis Bt18247 TaxID=1423143 RepID=A0A9W3XC68_BACTU|nr:hypothetical protein [Bacillus thuringiensis]AOM14186.1 hypothetical protein BTI247_58540 [Bacillus thuringiensis Bt18247]AOM14570.1 hypothetical protein BTI247_62400 [Bacillus thuringiensis Bt18247]MBG9524471.1 hypothetical protein [Bacillus thuringiensis]MBG9525853.1 hypothetical protein [Bacillus thuringiensis]MBG9526528.1 hypothetical protein [Bacillus thuringiensis]
MSSSFFSFIRHNKDNVDSKLSAQNWINCITYLSEMSTKPKSIAEWFVTVFGANTDITENDFEDIYNFKQLNNILHPYHRLNHVMKIDKIYQMWTATFSLKNLGREIIQYTHALNSVYKSEIMPIIETDKEDNIFENEYRSLLINFATHASLYSLNGKNILANIQDLTAIISSVEETNLVTLNRFKQYMQNVKITDSTITNFLNSILVYLETDVEKMKKNIIKEKDFLIKTIELWVFGLDNLERRLLKNSNYILDFSNVDSTLELAIHIEDEIDIWKEVEEKVSIFLTNWENYLQLP